MFRIIAVSGVALTLAACAVGTIPSLGGDPQPTAAAGPHAPDTAAADVAAPATSDFADSSAALAAAEPVPLPPPPPARPIASPVAHPVTAAVRAPAPAPRPEPRQPAPSSRTFSLASASERPVRTASAAPTLPALPAIETDGGASACARSIADIRARVREDVRRGEFPRAAYAKATADLRRADHFCRLGRSGEAGDALATLKHRYGVD